MAASDASARPGRLGDALAAAPAVAAAARGLRETGTRAWVVGGAVRDGAMGLAVADADLAVDGEVGRAARAIAAAGDGAFAFELSAEFATWRVVAPGHAWSIDLTALAAGSIEADLGLRDFTVNAIAVPLDDLAAAPLDPHAGLADVEARLLRAVSAQSFDADPLRILRAARLAAGLGFAIEPATALAARELSDRAGEPAGERQLAELRVLVGGPDPVGGLALLDELGATAAVLPELAALRGVGQNPNHHLDVHGHTIEVLSNLLEVERDLERYAGAAAPAVAELLAEPLADELSRGTALRFGAILHDAGKPATRQEHEGGFVSFVGHDREGARIVAAACRRLRTSRALERHLAALTRHHLHLGFMTAERPLRPRRLYEYLRLTDPVAADVTLLTVADRLSARGSGPTATPEMIEAHLALAREVLPTALAWHRGGPPRSPAGGDEVAAAAGIEPGPELGALIEEIEAAVFAGEVRSAGEALAYARAWAGGRA